MVALRSLRPSFGGVEWSWHHQTVRSDVDLDQTCPNCHGSRWEPSSCRQAHKRRQGCDAHDGESHVQAVSWLFHIDISIRCCLTSTYVNLFMMDIYGYLISSWFFIHLATQYNLVHISSNSQTISVFLGSDSMCFSSHISSTPQPQRWLRGAKLQIQRSDWC